MAGKLAGRFAARPMAAINLTPLVPVLLAVFAVVVLAGTVRPSPSLPLLNAPADPVLCVSCPPQPHIISVQQNGVVFMDARAVSLSEVADLSRRSDRGSTEVLVRADANVPYAKAFEVVQAAKRAGFRARLVNEDLH